MVARVTLGAALIDGLPTSLVRPTWLSELAALRRAHRANWILREVPATNRPPGASSPSLRGRLCREQRETRARTRVVTRSLSVKNPGPVLRGTLPHAIRREFPTPHPISEFSSATDKSASSPGCSISAAPIDLAAARTCSPRMAPRYREAFVTVSSRRSFSVSELHLKDFDRCDALT